MTQNADLSTTDQPAPGCPPVVSAWHRTFCVFEPVGIDSDVHQMGMMQPSIEHGGDIIILTAYYEGSIFMLLTGFLVLYCLTPIV